MRFRGLGSWWIWAAAAVAVTISMSSTAWAQSTSSSSSTSNSSSNTNSTAAGVAVDAEGVLRTKTFTDPTGQLMKERIAAAKSTLDPKITAFSKLRKVSLNRLEQAILDHGNTMTDEMRYLAGLLRVHYVFYYPETKDIVIAGPAEGWVPDAAGRIVGIGSGRPVVQLQDLVVALRAFPTGGSVTPQIGCSIDPTKEGLASMQQFLRGNRPNPNQPEPFVEALRNSLGFQLVSISGVSPRTRFAQVMVEADYRMKLIGIGLEKAPVKLISYVDRAKPADMNQNALQRWFFVPNYQCVRQSEDKLAMELVGDGVKLVGEDEVVMGSGERKTAAGRGSRASHGFVANFTEEYAKLAERSPVYAELRNLVDLAVASAYIQAEGYVAKAGWKMEFFSSESLYPVETYSIPKTVESAVNAVWKGQTLMTPIGGGVTIQATQALKSDNLLSDEKGKVGKVREATTPKLAKGQWWWD
jgi:hypothetical protein